jgi:lipoic acid synthetase
VKKVDPTQVTKSAIMAGLGETKEDIFSAMIDLAAAGCDVLAIGQYLRPQPGRLPVARYVAPEEFSDYKEEALRLGFKYAVAGPFVRSSYMAEEAFLASYAKKA